MECTGEHGTMFIGELFVIMTDSENNSGDTG
jgi:hypothetical protein